MNSRTKILNSISTLLAVFSLQLTGSENPPNFIVFLADDLAWADTSSRMDPDMPESGSTYSETPTIDELCKEGMRFSNAYSPAPMCTPTRRSIQFGMTPARQLGTEFLSHFDPKPYISIPQMLKSVDPDYTCAHFGKWGEAFTGSEWDRYETEIPGLPETLGYDYSDGPQGNITGIYWHWWWHPLDTHRNYVCEPHPNPKRTVTLEGRALKFLEKKAETKKPFYMQVSFFAVHTAYQAKKETIAKYEAKGVPPTQVGFGIAAMADDMDSTMGTILAKLEELGLSDNTYVIFTSDNGGEPTGSKYLDPKQLEFPGRCYPLNKEKQWLYEGGIRVPFVMKGPGIEPGSHSAEPIVGYDIWPTLYQLAGGTDAFPEFIDGGSFKDIIKGRPDANVTRPVDGLVFHRPKFKKSPHSVFRRGSYKLIHFWETGKSELYHLDNDISESVDLSEKRPAITSELLSALNNYLTSVDAEVYQPRPEETK